MFWGGLSLLVFFKKSNETNTEPLKTEWTNEIPSEGKPPISKYKYLTDKRFIVDFEVIPHEKKGNSSYFHTSVTEFHFRITEASRIEGDALGVEMRLRYFNTETGTNRYLDTYKSTGYQQDCFCIPIYNDSIRYEELRTELGFGHAYMSSHVYLDESTNYAYIFIDNGYGENAAFKGALKLKINPK